MEFLFECSTPYLTSERSGPLVRYRIEFKSEALKELMLAEHVAIDERKFQSLRYDGMKNEYFNRYG